MKKLALVILAALFFALPACANQAVDIAAIVERVAYHPVLPEERAHLRVGVVPGPYGDMFMDFILPMLAARGYTAELVGFDNFVEPNLALSAGTIDLNMFQHSHFLNNFKFEHDLDLSPVVEVPTVSMGVFSGVYTDLDDVSPGAVVILPDDTTNMARGLRVLEAAGIVTLDPLSDRSVATPEDIIRNPRELTFDSVDASLLVDALDANDLVVITGGFAFAGGLDIAAALYNEILGAGYMIVITVRTEDLGRQFVRDILDVIHSDAFKIPITADDSPFNGFQRPLYFIQ